MADITIRGAGILGLATAWVCVSRGARVRVIDPNGLGSGSSGGIVGALAPHVPENWNAKKAFQLESLLMAQDFWRAVHKTGDRDPGYRRSGRVQPIADQPALDLAHQRSATARELWKDQATWAVVDGRQDEWWPESPTGHFIHDDLSALLHPRLACDALAAALSSKGVQIEADGTETGPVLWATGLAGLEALNAAEGRTIGSGVKGQAALLRLDAGIVPQLFAEGLHVIPHLDGTVAIGSTSERDYGSPTSTDHLLDAVIAKARSLVPALKDAEVLQRWASVRPRARSRAPMLGPWPGRPGHFIANGGFKIGFGMAPKIADVMADLILENTDNIPDGFKVSDSY
jgi:glycine oxidase